MSLDIYLRTKKCPTCRRSDEGFSANITHNLTAMAEAVGVYKVLWRPDENGITWASQLIEPLTNAIRMLKSNADKFKKYEDEDGWGTRLQFLSFLEDLLIACQATPDAAVEVSR